jgi:DNA (cytosine-5)-methyltransferase 1
MGQGWGDSSGSLVAVTGWQGEKAVIRYGSVCSGIEAATVAWHPLGWEAAWYSEIEPFPSAVLAHHYPTVPNYGDMTKFEEWPNEPINLLVGGTPCQSFSVAGLRKGLADPRGNLMLTYGAIARRYRPKWLVWENVPGVLSSNGGRDFGTFLGMLAELGYGFAYRVLDAQYFGVAQRRRRVFVVGYLGSWQRAAAVLFESHSLQGHPAPSREARKDVAGTIAARFGNSRNNIEEIAPVDMAYTTSSLAEYREGVGTLRANGGDLGGGSETLIAKTLTAGTGLRFDADTETLPITFGAQMSVPSVDFDVNQTLQAKNPMAVAFGGDIARSLTARHDSSPCADRGMDVVAVAQPMTGSHWDSPMNPHPTLNQSAKGSGGIAASDQELFSQRGSGLVAQPMAFEPGSIARNAGPSGESMLAPTLRREMGDNQPAVRIAMQVRRLTPVECERLQGFPDNYTNIPWRKKDEAPDGPRYKALGNSMAVPVMRWIGERIQQVEEL